MKTVFTTLPIYKNRASQCYERGLANGSKIFAPTTTPRHRLPSFQWWDDGDGAASVSSVELLNGSTETDITSYFVTLPTLYTSDEGEDYFMYNGATLKYALPDGDYFLRITMDNDYVYYSEWIHIECVYKSVGSSFTNHGFDTFTTSGTIVSSCIDAGAGAYADTTQDFAVYLGQVITVVFYLTETGATNPAFSIVSDSLGVISNVEDSAAGLNELTLTTTRAADDCHIRMQTTGTTNFSTTEILMMTQFSEKYVTLSFSNCCNLGDIFYEDNFMQTLWILSDNIEQQFPYVEKGQENGDGRFIPTFRRQEKTYVIRTMLVGQYMVDIMHRLRLHDLVTYLDMVGDTYIVEKIDVEHEWQFDDKYYATVTLILDLGEAITKFSCC